MRPFVPLCCLALLLIMYYADRQASLQHESPNAYVISAVIFGVLSILAVRRPTR